VFEDRLERGTSPLPQADRRHSKLAIPKSHLENPRQVATAETDNQPPLIIRFL